MSDQQTWLRAQLARFTYRPGWRWEIVNDGSAFAGSGFRLIVRYVAFDTYQPTREIKLTTVREVPPFVAEDRVARVAALRWRDLRQPARDWRPAP